MAVVDGDVAAVVKGVHVPTQQQGAVGPVLPAGRSRKNLRRLDHRPHLIASDRAVETVIAGYHALSRDVIETHYLKAGMAEHALLNVKRNWFARRSGFGCGQVDCIDENRLLRIRFVEDKLEL